MARGSGQTKVSGVSGPHGRVRRRHTVGCPSLVMLDVTGSLSFGRQLAPCAFVPGTSSFRCFFILHDTLASEWLPSTHTFHSVHTPLTAPRGAVTWVCPGDAPSFPRLGESGPPGGASPGMWVFPCPVGVLFPPSGLPAWVKDGAWLLATLKALALSQRSRLVFVELRSSARLSRALCVFRLLLSSQKPEEEGPVVTPLNRWGHRGRGDVLCSPGCGAGAASDPGRGVGGASDTETVFWAVRWRLRGGAQ